MARLIIKKYKNTNDKSAAFGKTYGRLVHQDTMNTSDLCRHMMKHGTIYTSDIVKGVVEKFIGYQSKESEYATVPPHHRKQR